MKKHAKETTMSCRDDMFLTFVLLCFYVFFLSSLVSLGEKVHDNVFRLAIDSEWSNFIDSTVP
jgi:hypothetical protein